MLFPGRPPGRDAGLAGRSSCRGRWLNGPYRQALSAACLSLLALSPAAADPWAGPGDTRLRSDLQLLADAGLIRAPLTTWPVSWGEVARDLGRHKDPDDRPPHVLQALLRVERAVAAATRTGTWRADGQISGATRPPTLRRFEHSPRDEGEFGAALQYTGEIFAARLQAALVADADDGETLRPDGSYLGAVRGNWMVSAGWIDRWWGPGWEGSLILGTNHRPVPSLTLERNYSDPFDSPWLSWIGQWRLALTYGLLDDEREDFPNAHFFGLRITWKPHDRLEVGLSRTAQLCGDGRNCDLGTFWDMLAGKDNDQALAEQPGNQLGGFDFRWSAPWLPVALYGQAIGEDEAGNLPSKYLGMVGAEAWGGLGPSTWRIHLEYADTTCGFYEAVPDYGCAYRNSIYTDGYQYLDRSIGHSLDGDSRQWAAGAVLIQADGSSWELATQGARLNRRGSNLVHSVSAIPLDLESADVYHRREFLGGDLSIGLGYEQRDAATPGLDQNDFRAFVRWARRFQQ